MALWQGDGAWLIKECVMGAYMDGPSGQRVRVSSTSARASRSRTDGNEAEMAEIMGSNPVSGLSITPDQAEKVLLLNEVDKSRGAPTEKEVLARVKGVFGACQGFAKSRHCANVMGRLVRWDMRSALKAMLDGGADPNGAGDLGSPLMIALETRAWDVAALLVARGAREGSTGFAAEAVSRVPGGQEELTKALDREGQVTEEEAMMARRGASGACLLVFGDGSQEAVQPSKDASGLFWETAREGDLLRVRRCAHLPGAVEAVRNITAGDDFASSPGAGGVLTARKRVSP